MNILVVESDGASAIKLRETLTRSGYTVHVVTTSPDALAEVEKWRPDLILANHRLPTLDSVALCRSLCKTSKVPILVLANRSETSTLVEVLDAGADGFVAAPISREELGARIRALQRRYIPGEAALAPEERVL